MSRSLGRLVGTLALTIGIPAAAWATIHVPSSYRQVNNGIGNCIFSDKALNFQKDDTWTVKSSFEGPQEVYARCFFPKIAGEYKDIGKLKSQMRGMDREPAGFWRRLQFDHPTFSYRHTVRLKEDWDQNRLDITRSGQCDFKTVPRTGDCIDIDKEVRNLARMKKASLPFTTEVCLHVEFDYVDEKMPNPDNVLEMIDKRQFHTMSKGCFDYTVR